MIDFFNKLYKVTEKEFFSEMKSNLSRNNKMFIVTANPEAFMYGGNDIDVTFSTVPRYLNDQHFTHKSADVSLGEASVYFDNCRIEGPVCPV